MPRSDVALLNIRLNKLEEEIKQKSLECIEKEGAIKMLENDQCNLKEEVEKSEDEVGDKNKVIEANISRINTLEEDLKVKAERVNILEPAVNRIMKSKQQGLISKSDPEELKKCKTEIRSKNQMIKQLQEHKSELANELKDLQEKLYSESNTDKCIKLTADLNATKAENKALEKDKINMKEALAALQTKLKEANNKLAEYQVGNIRLKEHNDQLYELAKSNKVVSNLQSDITKDKSEQKVVFTGKADESKTVSTVSPRIIKNFDRKCLFYENGHCKKNPCNYFHPSEICKSYSRYGNCSSGLNCRLRHPLNVCMKFLEGNCNLGENCVNQHPVNTPLPHTAPNSLCSLPYPPESDSIFPSSTQSFNSVPYPIEASSGIAARTNTFAGYRSSAVSEPGSSPSGSFGTRKQNFW